jgi:hypothetical protein
MERESRPGAVCCTHVPTPLKWLSLLNGFTLWSFEEPLDVFRESILSGQHSASVILLYRNASGHAFDPPPFHIDKLMLTNSRARLAVKDVETRSDRISAAHSAI